MKKIILLLLSFGVLIAPSVIAETVLYCQSELAIGLIKKNDSWTVSQFQPKRLTIKFNSDYSMVTEGSGSGGADFPMECKVVYSHKPNQIHCSNSNGTGDAFIYTKNKKRFLYTSLSSGGYTLNDKNPDTENIFAGTCATF